jgi:hypothetical protein
MGKHIRKNHRILTAAIGLLVPVLLGSCSSTPTPKPVSHPMSFPPAVKRIEAQKLWTRKVPGLVTDLNLSQDGSTVLIATVPDHDSLDPNASRNGHYAVMYSAAGKVLTKIEMPAQIKSQALSPDGALAVVATYDDKLRGYDRTGKMLWESDASCKPFFVNGKQGERILCFHDDDAEPELGFEVFDLQGNRLSDFPIKDDALTLKMAPDNQSFILALTHGKVMVFDSEFKATVEKKVSGEIVDVALTSGAKPAFAILYNKKKSSDQKLAYFGKKNFDFTMPEHADQIEMGDADDSSTIFSYSNGNSGQMLMRLGQKPAVTWKHSAKSLAEYSSQVVVSSETVWVGFQDQTPSSEHSHVLGFDFAGGLQTDIEVPAEEGAFLYTFGVAPRAHLIVVAADDGQLSLFKAE